MRCDDGHQQIKKSSYDEWNIKIRLRYLQNVAEFYLKGAESCNRNCFSLLKLLRLMKTRKRGTPVVARQKYLLYFNRAVLLALLGKRPSLKLN